VTPTSGKLLAGSDASGSKLALSTDGGSEGSVVLSGGDWNGKRKKEKKRSELLMVKSRKDKGLFATHR
jgi:hypothetical protein